jgi:hypothetical protein
MQAYLILYWIFIAFIGSVVFIAGNVISLAVGGGFMYLKGKIQGLFSK